MSFLTPKKTVSALKIKENWQIITDRERHLRGLIGARWHNPADRADIFQAAAEVFAVRFSGLATEEAHIIRVFGWFARNAARQIRCVSAEDLVLTEPAAELQTLHGSIQAVLAYCRRHDLAKVHAVVWVVLAGDDFNEAAQAVGLTAVQLHRQLRVVGQRIRLAGGEI